MPSKITVEFVNNVLKLNRMKLVIVQSDKITLLEVFSSSNQQLKHIRVRKV